jgi:hypothetical protein
MRPVEYGWDRQLSRVGLPAPLPRGAISGRASSTYVAALADHGRMTPRGNQVDSRFHEEMWPELCLVSAALVGVAPIIDPEAFSLKSVKPLMARLQLRGRCCTVVATTRSASRPPRPFLSPDGWEPRAELGSGLSLVVRVPLRVRLPDARHETISDATDVFLPSEIVGE